MSSGTPSTSTSSHISRIDLESVWASPRVLPTLWQYLTPRQRVALLLVFWDLRDQVVPQSSIPASAAEEGCPGAAQVSDSMSTHTSFSAVSGPSQLLSQIWERWKTP